MRVVVRLLLSALMVIAAIVGVGTAHAAEPMSKERAGRYYLAGTCETKRAYNHFDWHVWLGRKQISRREVANRLPEIKRLTARYARAEQRFLNRLKNPPAAWPSDVRTPVKRMATLQGRYVNALLRASRAANAGSWGFWIKTAWRAGDYKDYPEIIRERLELPPPGKGCGQLG
ncbi:hypothetical protein [Nocardioides ganghwensis]|uniref:Uncharacterized protein n=1 Tax=Nocardioides ganghwensis TaxID=252230 RepID=A0A4Q2SD36_9ACTN|nr:hypothetical protein [Nocardioides ganghwensis]MBD3946478.1 hypothetical protein [Nocardioides ganghwensis]RYC03225.1 hypothetical protein EUA07_06630 [Nocardioides ganghwensis]